MVSTYFQKAVSELKPETEIFVKHYLDITTCLLDLMEERGMTQKDFAEALNKNASEIRGVLLTRFQGTAFRDFILPIVNPKDMTEN